MKKKLPLRQRLFQTLREPVVAVAVAALLLWVAVHSTLGVLDQARQARTERLLQQARDCLVRRAVVNNRYPTFAPGGRIDCNQLTYDVNACLCQAGILRDAWGSELRYLEGQDNEGQGLAGRKILDLAAQVTAPATEVRPLPGFDSVAGVGPAFVLLSPGPDQQLDQWECKGRPLFPEAVRAATLCATGLGTGDSDASGDLLLITQAAELWRALGE